MSGQRKFAKIRPEKVWKSTLVAFSPNAKLLGIYMMTAPRYCMVGIYELPRYFMSKDTGLSTEEVSKALDELIQAEFCHYNDEREVVWVVDMAMTQVADKNLSEKQQKGVLNELARLHVDYEYPYVDEFISKYRPQYSFLPESIGDLDFDLT